MSYDFWKTGGLSPGLDPFDDGVSNTDGIEVRRMAADEFAVLDHGRIIAQTFSTYGGAALFADAYRRAQRARDRLQRGNR